MIARVERQTYEDVWATLGEEYAAWSPGVEYLPLFLDWVGADPGFILDAGCGSGRAAVELAGRGFRVGLCDLTSDGLCDAARALPFVAARLWDDLAPVAYALTAARGAGQPWVDWIYCADVLEHVPTALTMLAVARLCAVARRGVWLTISFQPDRSGYWVGRPLHQTVQPFTWWRDHLAEAGHVAHARDLIHHGLFALDGQARAC